MKNSIKMLITVKRIQNEAHLNIIHIPLFTHLALFGD